MHLRYRYEENIDFFQKNAFPAQPICHFEWPQPVLRKVEAIVTANISTNHMPCARAYSYAGLGVCCHKSLLQKPTVQMHCCAALCSRNGPPKKVFRKRLGASTPYMSSCCNQNNTSDGATTQNTQNWTQTPHKPKMLDKLYTPTTPLTHLFFTYDCHLF